jgi:hypothetical protein
MMQSLNSTIKDSNDKEIKEVKTIILYLVFESDLIDKKINQIYSENQERLEDQFVLAVCIAGFLILVF